jgi:hypothetical protein
VIKILKKVSNDYVYSGLDVDDEEDTKTWISQDMLDQMKTQEQTVANNDIAQQNQDLWSIMSSIPIDGWDTTNIPNVKF